MPAYIIVETDIHDPEQYERYKAASPGAVAAGGGRFVARGGELADLDAAKAWYVSEEYEAAKKLREGAANLRMVAVQGVD